MKKSGIAIGFALMFGLFAFAGCAATPQGGADGFAESAPEIEKSVEETAPQGGSDQEKPQGGSNEEKPQSGGSDLKKEDLPRISPLALLDEVDVSEALGDQTAEGWSFALTAAGDVAASYCLSFTSEISHEEKLNLSCGMGVGLEDTFGIRKSDEGALGVGLFGGGKASLQLNYRGPSASSDPWEKRFDLGFRHDGDLIFYAGEGEDAAQTSLSELKEKVSSAAMTKTFAKMKEAFTFIPEELEKGVSLRLAVEKLLDLGFTAEIDDTNGIAITLKASMGFYTDLLNDALESIIPADLLKYLPRMDFGYEKTLFNICLAFDENGMFKEYSMSSDVALSASLEVRSLFTLETAFTYGGNFLFNAASF